VAEESSQLPQSANRQTPDRSLTFSKAGRQHGGGNMLEQEIDGFGDLPT
jgi:hypothetical protein